MVSILLAVYNGERYLEKSIQSVLSQTYQNFEILIGFNGTTDRSKEIAAKFGDCRLRIFDYGLERGKAQTLNKLLKESQFEWIAIQDDDDIWLPQKLECQVKYMFTGKYDVIGTGAFYCNSRDEVIGFPTIVRRHHQIVTLTKFGYNQIINTSSMFKRKFAIEVGGWNAIDGVEDYEFWLRLINNGAVFFNLKERLVLHRLHSLSNFNTKSFDLSPIQQKYLEYSSLSYFTASIHLNLLLLQLKSKNLIFKFFKCKYL